MNLIEALKIVGGTIVTLSIIITACWRPIKAYIGKHDAEKDETKRLEDNDTQTEANRKTIEQLANEFETWRGLTEKRLEKGTQKMNRLEENIAKMDCNLSSNSILLEAMNAKLDLLVEDRIYSSPVTKNSEMLKEVHEEKIKSKLRQTAIVGEK